MHWRGCSDLCRCKLLTPVNFSRALASSIVEYSKAAGCCSLATPLRNWGAPCRRLTAVDRAAGLPFLYGGEGMDDDKIYFTVEEAADQIGVSERWLADQCRAGTVEHVHIARKRRFTRQQVLKLGLNLSRS